MLRHEALGIAIRDAVIAGELDTARRDAELLERVMFRTHAPALIEPLAQMRAATREVAGAADLHAAAKATGDLAATCAGCHRERNAHPSALMPLAGAPPPPGMQRHAWAANALWNGMVGGHDEPWRAGAESFADPANAVTPTKEATHSAESLEALGRRAAEATTSTGRAEIYGELLETCAACHAATR